MDWTSAIRREAEAHAAFFGSPGDEQRITERMAVSRANVALDYTVYLVPYLDPPPTDFHDALLALGYQHERHPAHWEDVGGPESGPRLEGHDEWDEYTSDVDRVCYYQGRAHHEPRDLEFDEYCDRMAAASGQVDYAPTPAGLELAQEVIDTASVCPEGKVRSDPTCQCILHQLIRARAGVPATERTSAKA